MCQILASIKSDLRCVQQNDQNDCTANALEVIEPLESETDHLQIQLACPNIRSFPPVKPKGTSVISFQIKILIQ